MSQHVQDTAIFERRLRPIYDNLEVGNYRKALQETGKVLKKHPNLLCARALKGLALLRLGRYEESNEFLREVTKEKPVDDSTLQVVSFCYKELEQLEKIVDLYNYAVQQSPGNEELLALLFIAHVRMEDFKSQQSVALQLYKVQPKNSYYFWAVMSVVLQGVRGPESKNPDKRKIYLALANRMVEKIIKENKMETEQEVLLYLRILTLQENFEGALDFVNGPICEKLFPGMPSSHKIDFLIKLERWQELNALLKDMLRAERDRWDFYLDYLTSCFELYRAQLKDNEAVPKDEGKNALCVLDDCHDFLCELMEAEEKTVRGPYLARLELHKRMRDAGLNAHELLGDFSELLIEYFRLFGDKSCCTHDISLFLPSIAIEARKELATKLLQESGITSTKLPQNKEQMQKHICALQVSRICGSHMDLQVEHLLALYTALKLHYEHGLSSFGQNLLHTDMGPSDPYALLAANVMYDVSLQEKKSDRIFEALCLLQYVLRNSTSNFHVKLMSLKIFHMFGCLMGAQEMYDYLEIKQIQLDAMGYIHCNVLPLAGRFSMGRFVFDATLKFFTSSFKDRLEYIALTYRFGTFSKLEEFMNFKDRLTNSLHYVSTTVEAQLCDLVTMSGTVQSNLSAYAAMSVDPAEDRITWTCIRDNRDLGAIVRWDPIHLVDADSDRKESFKQDVEVLRIRSLLLRLIASFLDLYHPSIKIEKSLIRSTMNNTSPNAKNHAAEENAKETDTVESLRDAWTVLFERLRKLHCQPLSNRFLVNLLPTRLHLLLEMPYEQFFRDMAQCVLDFYVGAVALPLQCKVVCDHVSRVVEICKETIKESNEAADGLWRRREWQSKVASCLEILSLYAVVMAVLQEKMQLPGKAKSKKKGNENDGKQIVSEKERSLLLVELIRHLKKNLQTCEIAIQSWKMPALPLDLNSFMADMSLKPEVEATLIGDVAAMFRESHELMVTELKNLVRDKARMLSK